MIKKTPNKYTIEFIEKVFLLLLLFVFFTIKLFFLMHAKPLPDEAYYWLWSKNMSFSYFDHPPMVSWSLALLSSFFDNKYFIIRTLPLLGLGIVLTVMIVWQKYIFLKYGFGTCLKNTVLFLAFPINAIFFSISFPDYMLITLLFACSFCLFLFFERNILYYWYTAVLLFSLALLTKYNAVLFGLGILIYILYSKKEIKSPSYGHIIASIFIIFLIQMPVLYWNFENDFVSFSFHLNERLDNGKDLTNIFKNNFGFLLGVFIAFSPIFIFSLGYNFKFGNFKKNVNNFVIMSKFVLVFSISFCILLSFFTNVLYYWVIPGAVLLIPFLSNIIRSKMWQYIHIFYGMLISLILLINIAVFPISAFFGNVDRETGIIFGWEQIINAIDKEKKERGIEKVIFSDYRLGSLYIFHSEDFEADVFMEERRTQFDIWRGQGKLLEEKALIVTDKDFPLSNKISSNFKSFEHVRNIKVYKNKTFLREYQVFLGKNT